MSAENSRTALLLVLVAMFLLGIGDNLVQIVAREIGLWQFHMMRSIVTIALLLCVVVALGGSVRPKRFWYVQLRSWLVAISMFIYFGCLGFLPVGQVAAGLFTSPIWVMVISAVFLNNPIGLKRASAAALGFLGVLIVLDPFADGLNIIALFPILAGLFYALGAIATQRLCADEDTFAVLLPFFVVLMGAGTVVMGLMEFWPHAVPEGADGFLTRGFVWPSMNTLLLLAFQGVLAMMAMGLIVRAYQTGETATVAIYEYSLLGFAALWAYVFYGDTITLWAVFGMALIVISGVIISLRSREG